MPIQSVGVVGCGLMGSGIAQVCAQKGHPTMVREINDEALKKGLDRIRAFLGEGVRRGKMTQSQMDQVLGNLRGTTSLSDLKDCDLVIEAVVENLDEKRRVFAELDRVCKPSTLFASNTSSISIAAQAQATRRPDRFLGLHFMNPVPLMKLVEIVRPDAASAESYATAKAFAESLGKVTVTAKDTPGFIVAERIKVIAPHPLATLRFENCVVADGALWVASVQYAVTQIDPGSGSVLRTIELPRSPNP